MSETLKLVPDMIPGTSFFKNLRAILKPGEWDTVRRAVYAKAGHKCEVCGVDPRVLECHEAWEYDEQAGVQRLARLMALCSKCHEVKHIGLAQMRGRLLQARKHMMTVNGIDRKTADVVIREAYGLWRQRSSRQWTLDVTALGELSRPVAAE